MDGKGGGIGILLLIGVVAMALMGKKKEAEAAVGVPEIPIEPYVPLEPVAPEEVPVEGRVSTPADAAMARQRAKSYAAREAEALAYYNELALQKVAEQKAR